LCSAVFRSSRRTSYAAYVRPMPLIHPRRTFALSKDGIPIHFDGPPVNKSLWDDEIGELLEHADMERPPVQWADYRPNLVEVEVIRNADGELEGQWDNETVVFPELEATLEWVLSTPLDEHLFEEVPIVKECPDESDTV